MYPYIRRTATNYGRYKYIIMLSKITIEVQDDGLPFISIKFVPSDDVRDKLIQRFIDRFEDPALYVTGYASFAIFRHNEDGGKSCTVHPNSPARLAECMQHITDITVPHMKAAADKGFGLVTPSVKDKDGLDRSKLEYHS